MKTKLLTRSIAAAVVLAGLSAHTQPVHAQATAADSAAVLLDHARRMGGDDARLARELLRYLARRFPDTPAGRESAALLRAGEVHEARTSGHAGLTVSNTLFGAWLGLAVPAALGAESPEPFGAGLLIGAPVGFGATKLFTGRYPVSSGQAIATAFGGWWGTWQGLGWREVLDIGSQTRTYCYDDGLGNQFCDTYEEDPSEAPFAGAVVGGIAGLMAGSLLSQAFEPNAGQATLIEFGGIWGSWFGLATAILADVDADDGVLAWTLIGSDLGLVASALAAKSAGMSAGRVWLISAAGLAGGVAGLGLDLLIDVQHARSAILPPLLGSIVGLGAGVALTADYDGQRFGASSPMPGAALVNVAGGTWTVAPVLPTPTVARLRAPDGVERTSLGLAVPVFAAKF